MVPFGDLSREAGELGDAVSAAIQGVLDSGWFILGPEVEAFERELASWLGASYAVGVASGTEALTIALRALDIGPGDEVITAANTCVPTAAGIVGSGATLRLADCDPDTLMISPQSAEAAVTPRTRALVPVHLYGGGANMAAIRELADRKGLLIVEDCAQAIGTTIGGLKAGSQGDATAFSFYPTKNLGAYGDGGCVVTSTSDVCERARSLRNYGYLERDHSVELGLNSRLDPIQAAILRVKLPYVVGWNSRRRQIATSYGDTIRQLGVTIPVVPDYVEQTFHLFVIRVPDREVVQSRLDELGIQTQVHYPLPLHMQPTLRGLGYGIGDFPNSERACSEVLSLPMFPQLTDGEVEEVVDALTFVFQEATG